MKIVSTFLATNGTPAFVLDDGTVLLFNEFRDNKVFVKRLSLYDSETNKPVFDPPLLGSKIEVLYISSTRKQEWKVHDVVYISVATLQYRDQNGLLGTASLADEGKHWRRV